MHTAAHSRSQADWLLGSALAVAAIVEIVARISGGPGFLLALQLDDFTQFACVGAYAMYRFWADDSLRTEWVVRLGVAVAAALLLLPLVVDLPLRETFGLALVALGAIGLGAMTAAAFGGQATERPLWRQRLASMACLIVGVGSGPFALWLSAHVNPVYDIYVFAFEETLGARFSVLAVQVFASLPPLRVVCTLCYLALPFGIIVLYVLQQPQERDVDILIAFAASTAIGLSLYFVFPVVGPLTAFGDVFPRTLPPAGSIALGDLTIAALAPRNGMPSLHTAWALLIWFNARPLAPLARRSFRLFAVLNLFATMGLTDAHWITDLIVATPMAVAAQALCSTARPLRSRARWLAIGGGMGLVFAWFAALRWGIAVFESLPGLSWIWVVATLLVSAALERGLRPPVEARARHPRAAEQPIT